MSRTDRLPVATLLAAALAACGEAPPPQPEAESLLSEAHGISISALPAPFEVSSNDQQAVVLVAPELAAPSTVTIRLSQEYPGGLNIIDAVETELDEFAGRPEGRSFGQTQLVAPIGLVYMARGRWSEQGTAMEELEALVAHPWGNRLLSLAYTYPVGDDTQERGAQLMELLGEVEALEAPQLPE